MQLLGGPWISYACSSMPSIAFKKLTHLADKLGSNLTCFDRSWDRTTYLLVVLCSCSEKKKKIRKTLQWEGILMLKGEFHLNQRIYDWFSTLALWWHYRTDLKSIIFGLLFTSNHANWSLPRNVFWTYLKGFKSLKSVEDETISCCLDLVIKKKKLSKIIYCYIYNSLLTQTDRYYPWHPIDNFAWFLLQK